MKVLILHNDFRVYWKGRLTFLKSYLAEKEIDLFAVEMFGKGSPYSFDVYENTESWWTCLFPENKFEDLSKVEIKKVLYAKLDEIKPDVIIAGSIVFSAGALGIRWAKKNQKKFIMFDDALPSQVKRNPIVQYIKDIITQQVDGIWLPSKKYDDEYKKYGKKSLLFYGYNCIDNSLFHNDIKNQSKSIICVARLVPIKNLSTLVKAWEEVEKQNTGYNLIIAGGGPEFENLNNQIGNLNLKTISLTGHINYADLPKYFQNKAAFILASFAESWGLVVNEAMAAGLPILLSNTINAGKTLLYPEKNGFNFNPYDSTDIANAIMKFIHLSEDNKYKMSQHSKEVIGAMDYENMGKNLTEALFTLLPYKAKSQTLLARALVRLWNGRYNTKGWDQI